jgi:acyl-CoA thioester hydrolase
MLGHVNNVTWVKWVQDVAVAHSSFVGWNMAAYQAFGAVWVVRRHLVDYFAPAFRDDELVGLTWVEGLRGTSCVRHTVFTRSGNDTCLVRAATTWVLVDTRGRPRGVPEEMRCVFMGE